MKKILLLSVSVMLVTAVMAQETIKTKQQIDLSNRPNDHFLLQFGVLNWSGLPDTINKSGFAKSINVYFLFDFPFKTNPHMSVAFGPGIGSDHMLFTKTHIGIRDVASQLRFTNVSDTNHYKKTKLATVYLEAPVELRYSSNPIKGGFKAALGVKVGTMINAHTRNTKFQDRNNKAINDFTQKESSKNYFNKNRLSLTARAGWGHFTLYGAYQITPLIRDGFGPVIHPYSIGITLSGL